MVEPICLKKRDPAVTSPRLRSGKAFCATTTSTENGPPMPSPMTTMLRMASSSVVDASMRASSTAPTMPTANSDRISAL